MQLVKNISVNDILEDGVVEGLRYIILKSGFSLNGYIERPDILPEEVDNKLYWSLDVHGRFSFSTVHDVDKLPGSATWTVKDVQLECIHVAEQLRELERKLE